MSKYQPTRRGKMAKQYPCGVILSGAFEKSYIYYVNEDQLAIIRDKYVNVFFNQLSPVHTIQYEIDEETVSQIEITGSEPKPADYASAGAAAVLISPILGYAVHESSKGLIYSCVITFKDGKKSLIKIDDSKYSFIQKLMFKLSLNESDSIGARESLESNVSQFKQFQKEGNASNENISEVNSSQQKSSTVNINPNNIEPTITRIELFLEDKEWGKVKDYSNAALDYFPTDYRLYMFLLFAELQISDFDELEKCKISFSGNSNYKKAIRFADSDTSDKLKSYALKAEASQKEEMQNRDIGSIDNTISNEDSDFEVVECDSFLVYLPKHFTQEVMNRAGRITTFGPENDSISVMTSREDTIKDITFPRGPFVIEENITSSAGSFHMVSWIDPDASFMVWAEYYCKLNECEKGLCVRALYANSSGIDYYEIIKKGVLNIKIN